MHPNNFLFYIFRAKITFKHSVNVEVCSHEQKKNTNTKMCDLKHGKSLKEKKKFNFKRF